MPYRYLCSIILILMGLKTAGQEIDNTTSYKHINSGSYIRLSVDNDYFVARDQQYTEGMNLEVCLPALKKNPMNKLLVHPHYSYTRYGLGLEQAGYTPRNLRRTELQVNDRPFASTLFLKVFLITTDTIHKQKFATTLSAGIIGPDALGEEVQDFAHQWLNNIQPVGWKYQVHDDVILNYQVEYEKQLIAFRNLFSFSADATARIGTLSDKAGMGVTAIAGYIDNAFGPVNPNKKFHLFIYDRPAIDVIGYDATLEGGFFNRTSPYTLPADQLNRLIFVNRFGCVATLHRVTLEYFQCYTSRQFIGGPRNRWGGVQMAVALK